MYEDYNDIILEGRLNDKDELIDKYLNMKFISDVGTNNELRGTLFKRSRGLDGIAIGGSHTNPFFDTREYEIEFIYGTWDKYAEIPITENIYAHVDD